MASRIYVVTNKDTQAASLVEASTRAQALRHIVEGSYEVEPARPMDVANLMGQGVTVQKAGEDAT